MKRKEIMLALAVAMMAGSVSVEHNGKTYELGAGVSRAFGEEETIAQHAKIEAGRSQYVAKNHEAWKSRGRIVGTARNAPAFTVTILTPSKQQVTMVSSEKLNDGKMAYEIWLEPGSYVMVVRATAYQSLDLKDLEVRKGSDLRIDLEFTGARD